MDFRALPPQRRQGRLEKKGPGDYSFTDIAGAVGLSVRHTRLSINLVCCTINTTKLKFKYNSLVSGKTNTQWLFLREFEKG
jgi:hypothetical protein